MGDLFLSLSFHHVFYQYGLMTLFIYLLFNIYCSFPLPFYSLSYNSVPLNLFCLDRFIFGSNFSWLLCLFDTALSLWDIFFSRSLFSGITGYFKIILYVPCSGP